MTAALNLVGASPNKIKKIWEIKRLGCSGVAFWPRPFAAPAPTCAADLDEANRFLVGVGDALDSARANAELLGDLVQPWATRSGQCITDAPF
jgi:hypothetical protein